MGSNGWPPQKWLSVFLWGRLKGGALAPGLPGRADVPGQPRGQGPGPGPGPCKDLVKYVCICMYVCIYAYLGIYIPTYTNIYGHIPYSYIDGVLEGNPRWGSRKTEPPTILEPHVLKPHLGSLELCRDSNYSHAM